MADATKGGESKKKKSPPSTIGTEQPEKRAKWGNKLQFILSCVGYSVGLGNIWRFSYMAFENGGGAFLIPYLISVVMAGLPLYAFELALGQFSSLGPTSVFRRLAPLYQGIGWGMVSVSFHVSLYYNVIVAWILYYFCMSFKDPLQWSTCDNTWNTFRCMTVRDVKECNEKIPMGIYYNKNCYSLDNLTDISFQGTYLSNGAINGDKIPPTRVENDLLTTLGEYPHRSSAEEYFNFYIQRLPEHEKYAMGKHTAMNWPMCGFFALAWLLVFLCLIGGVQTSGKVVYFTALFPYLVLFILLIYGLTLEGAGTGIKFYVTPNGTKLREGNVWRKAAVQVFFSLGPAQGGLITLASYNEFDNNFLRDATIVTVIDSLTSSLAGFATFSIVGHMAHLMQTGVREVAQGGAGLAFIVMPQVFAEATGANFWCIMFFLMLLTLGLDSQFVLFETVTTGLMDQFPKLQKRKAYVTGVGCVVCFLLGLPMCTNGGLMFFQIWDDYSSGYTVMLLAVYETVVLCWVYGLNRLLKDIERMVGSMPNYYWRVTWAVVAPAYMLFIFMATVSYDVSKTTIRGQELPDKDQYLGWAISSSAMVFILGFAAYRIGEVIYKKLPFSMLITPTPHWCPAFELLKRSPARHEGSARIHLLDHPHAPPPAAGGMETGPKSADDPSSSILKSIETGPKSAEASGLF